MDDVPGVSPSVAAELAAATSHQTFFSGSPFSFEPTISRATSPGLPPEKVDENDKRYWPRTFSYFQLLPFQAEDKSDREAALARMLKNLYMSLKAEDFSPGAQHWTRDLKSWISLKFELTRELRARLARLYYKLCLTPGLSSGAADRFAQMVITLLRRRHYLKPGDDLTLDWRPLWKQVKSMVLPSEATNGHGRSSTMPKHLLRLVTYANPYFDPKDRREMLEELLPYFSTSELSNAYIVVGAISFMMPTAPAPPTEPLSQPSDWVPTFFHLWALMNRSKTFDVFFIDIFSRMARDFLACTHVPFGEHGVFTREQSDLIFTAILRLTEIPVGQSSSPYSTLDYHSGPGLLLEKDKKKHPVPYMAARWIVHSLSPVGLDQEGSIMASLEGLMESTDTFFHPSNSGSWTTFLAQFTFYLGDLFLQRWNREQSRELDVPSERRITPALKRRFVLALKEHTFTGIFSKSSRATHHFNSCLQSLSYLEPDVILPGALQRFYPSLQGLVEVHRTTASLACLQILAHTMTRVKGFRCHVLALLGLALPGIDANDLNKTQQSLLFIQAVAYSIPLCPLTGQDGEIHDASLAKSWLQGETERMEREGQNVEINYDQELTDEDEAKIVSSSTAALGEFVLALLERIFTLLENLPEGHQSRVGSPEDNVINSLPSALTPVFASLSPELYDMALEKLTWFVTKHVYHPAKDATAWLVNAICKVNPKKGLKALVGPVMANIRNEIDWNGAASDRSSGNEVLPRDRALVWHVSILSMSVVHVGAEVLEYKKQLLDMAQYMEEKCRGLPTHHISNFVHHLLLNLTTTYPIDHGLFEPSTVANGLSIHDWGRLTPPSELTIQWHRPSRDEMVFAFELFETQVNTAFSQLERLMNDTPPVHRQGKHKEWSDDFARAVNSLRLVLSGVAALFENKRSSRVDEAALGRETWMDMDNEPLGDPGDEDFHTPIDYAAGYQLGPNDPIYTKLHEMRDKVGVLLSRMHGFLCLNQEDDVTCFTVLYSTYRTWITDVQYEKSAHPLDRLQRLYKNDVAPFRLGGLRKQYPRPLLIRRATLYYLQRLKYVSQYRRSSEIDNQLLRDLAESCVSVYADVRRVAQGAQDSALKVLIGCRTKVIPIILDKYQAALDANDHDKIKGAMYTLLYTSLLNTLFKDWRFAPSLIRLYFRSSEVDKESIQKIVTSGLMQLINFGKPYELLVLLDHDAVETIRPPEDCSALIKQRHDFIHERRAKVEEKKAALGLELVAMAKECHWKTGIRCVIFASNLCVRFRTLAPPEFIDLIVRGVNDSHPGVRANHQNALHGVFNAVELRALHDHDEAKYYMDQNDGDKHGIELEAPGNDPNGTEQFLAQFAKMDPPDTFVDADHPGWLVWGKTYRGFRAHVDDGEEYDEVEMAVRGRIGAMLTRDWLQQAFEYMKQEPRDSSHDRFRMQNVWLVANCADLILKGSAVIQFDELTEMTKAVYGDGSDKHQHRATAEILGGMLTCAADLPLQTSGRIWAFVAPFLLKIIAEDLTPDNMAYWSTLVHLQLQGKDPRRSKELIQGLSGFRLDIKSNAAFKEASKAQLLEWVLNDAGWHFRLEKPIMDDFLAHLDHPYKSVRESIGRVIAAIYRTRYHESFPSVAALLEQNKAASSIGIRPYGLTDEFQKTILSTFAWLEKCRHQRTPGQQTPCSYTSGSKTVLVYLDNMLSSQECIQLVPFFADPFVDELLHMMDVKEDPELTRLAYHVYRHLPNIPLRPGSDEDEVFVAALVRIGKRASSWHQRLRALVNMQVLYFRRLFLTQAKVRLTLFDTVSDMLSDSQLEVRDCAALTLAGMIRCSPHKIREPIIANLRRRFEAELRANPMPKRKAPGVDTSVDAQQKMINRHAAVLGLGALVQAFPYATPPPRWMPEVLAHLAMKTAGDRGIVGQATKKILAEFKKTRQDSWGSDKMYFTPEQLENLEGVLWKSYFA